MVIMRVLLSAALRVLRPASAAGPAAARECCRQRWRDRRGPARIIGQIRQTWPRVRIILRGDSGFANEPLMRWCEEHRVDYVFGLARNSRLEAALGKQGAEARLPGLGQARPGVPVTSAIARVTAGAANGALSARPSTRRTVPILALSSPRSKHARMADPRALYEDLSAPVARPRTALASSSNCSQIVPRPPP